MRPSENSPLVVEPSPSPNGQLLVSSTDPESSQVISREPTLLESLVNTWKENFWSNLFLVFVPLGIIAEYCHFSDTWIFILNFLAIIPLAKLLDLATDQLSERVGQSVGALINASFGNAVEVIIGIFGLAEGLLSVVQSSIIGSILSNLLFVLGVCFMVGGLKHTSQTFSAGVANVGSSLLSVSIFGFLLPAVFAGQLGNWTGHDAGDHTILFFSRGTAILLLISYIAYLFFQLVTHPHIFKDEPDTIDGVEEEEEEPKLLNLPSCFILLVVATTFIAICAEALVGSIQGLSVNLGISKTFIGLIILPIVGNAAEHVTALFAAMRNKMNLSIGVALGSSMQIALFVSPLMVLIGWMMNASLTLNYTPFDTAVLFISILIVNHIVHDGESNWLEGFLLLVCYFIVGLAYFFLPEPTA